MEITKTIAWMLYSAIEKYRQDIITYGLQDQWLEWIQCIRLAKMDLYKEFKFE